MEGALPAVITAGAALAILHTSLLVSPRATQHQGRGTRCPRPPSPDPAPSSSCKSEDAERRQDPELAKAKQQDTLQDTTEAVLLRQMSPSPWSLGCPARPAVQGLDRGRAAVTDTPGTSPWLENVSRAQQTAQRVHLTPLLLPEDLRASEQRVRTCAGCTSLAEQEGSAERKTVLQAPKKGLARGAAGHGQSSLQGTLVWQRVGVTRVPRWGPPGPAHLGKYRRVFRDAAQHARFLSAAICISCLHRATFALSPN